LGHRDADNDAADLALGKKADEPDYTIELAGVAR
jgi:hypothetical protein